MLELFFLHFNLIGWILLLKILKPKEKIYFKWVCRLSSKWNNNNNKNIAVMLTNRPNRPDSLKRLGMLWIFSRFFTYHYPNCRYIWNQLTLQRDTQYILVGLCFHIHNCIVLFWYYMKHPRLPDKIPNHYNQQMHLHTLKMKVIIVIYFSKIFGFSTWARKIN